MKITEEEHRVYFAYDPMYGTYKHFKIVSDYFWKHQSIYGILCIHRNWFNENQNT